MYQIVENTSCIFTRRLFDILEFLNVLYRAFNVIFNVQIKDKLVDAMKQIKLGNVSRQKLIHKYGERIEVLDVNMNCNVLLGS